MVDRQSVHACLDSHILVGACLCFSESASMHIANFVKKLPGSFCGDRLSEAGADSDFRDLPDPASSCVFMTSFQQPLARVSMMNMMLMLSSGCPSIHPCVHLIAHLSLYRCVSYPTCVCARMMHLH